MEEQTLRVLIVGCGNIAGKFDMCEKTDEFPYTHAGAYKKDKRFIIEACVEPDNIVRKEFMEYWGIPSGFSQLSELDENVRAFDVVSICSPTVLHKSDVLKVIALKPRLIFCEKPVTTQARDTYLLMEKCHQKNILLAVNHTRRWDPEVVSLKHSIASEHYGKLRSVVAFYNKGILNNGSHLIDVLHYLLGNLKVIAVSDKFCDYSGQDPSVPALLETDSHIPVHLVTGHAEDFALFELQFIFSEGVLTMQEGGGYWQKRKSIESQQFEGYRILDKSFELPGGYQQAMLKAVDNIYQAVTFGSPLASDGNSAYQAQVMCEKIANFRV